MTSVLLLAKLVALQGTWVAREDGKDFPATFESAAKNTAVVQKSGFLIVYSLDGDALLATVWVDDGFSSRFRARAPKAGEKTIVFELADTANKAAAANGFADRFELELSDADHVVQRWRWKAPKAAPATISIELRRNVTQ